MSTLTLSRAQRRPMVDVTDVMVRHGYHVSPSYEGMRFYPKGTSRDAMRDGEVAPMVTIPRKMLKWMAEICHDEQSALAAVVHYAKHGELMNPNAQDVEAAVQAQTERQERENAILRDRLDKMGKQLEQLMKGREPEGESQPNVNVLVGKALAALDHDNDDHWTTDGQPRVEVVQASVGDQFDVTRALIREASPGFERERAKS